jgi:hypothetical protein
MARTCALCNKTITVDRLIPLKASCVHCSGDLHICLNCKFYSPTAHNKCLEPKSEFQRSRDRANFCDFFVFRDSVTTQESDGVKEAAKKAFEDLFRK